jgi:hypothetical protein
MLFANSDNDRIFPMDGNRRVMEKLRKIYGMYERPDDLREYVSAGGHDYRPDLRVAIFKFFNKHLKGDATTPVEDSAKYTPLKGRELRVFPEDADVPKDAINGRVDETFITPAKVKLPEKGKFEEWKKEMVAKVRAKCFRPFPETIPIGNGYMAGSLFVKTTDRHAIIIPNEKVKDPSPLLAFADQFPGCPERRLELLLVKENMKHEFVIVSPVGETAFSWTPKSPPNYVERSHALLGHTTDQGKIRDFIESVRYLQKGWKLKETRIGGCGRDGILAAYAALFEPSVNEVIVIDPPKSHKEGPHFLNVLRVLDIPEALGLLAPRPLTIIGGKHPAFNTTEEIYRLAGAADKLTRK